MSVWERVNAVTGVLAGHNVLIPRREVDRLADIAGVGEELVGSLESAVQGLAAARQLEHLQFANTQLSRDLALASEKWEGTETERARLADMVRDRCTEIWNLRDQVSGLSVEVATQYGAAQRQYDELLRTENRLEEADEDVRRLMNALAQVERQRMAAEREQRNFMQMHRNAQQRADASLQQCNQLRRELKHETQRAEHERQRANAAERALAQERDARGAANMRADAAERALDEERARPARGRQEAQLRCQSDPPPTDRSYSPDPLRRGR